MAKKKAKKVAKKAEAVSISPTADAIADFGKAKAAQLKAYQEYKAKQVAYFDQLHK